ncbi:Pr6Pr family membrane protein [Nocardioides sp.]|uniref:Pr6Pr family membrane protein n=1 Tax=Nocardioides sp. TaxID=35761 RepID=UPI003D0BDEB1
MHPTARRWHLLTAGVAIVALLLQLVLIVAGVAVLNEAEVPGLGIRLGRFLSYFTIQSNALVALTAVQLARNPQQDGHGWRVARLCAIAGITVTGLVHFVLLRPLLHLEGWNWAADKLLHMVVPVLAVAGWGLFGPRPRITARTVGWALLWPIVWLGWTLMIGATTGWYPYPFLDVADKGVGSVGAACLGVTTLFLVVFAALATLDRRLDQTS